MILPEADLAAAIPRRQFASLDAALKYFHHRLTIELQGVSRPTTVQSSGLIRMFL
jgi:hypothetical protein